MPPILFLFNNHTHIFVNLIRKNKIKIATQIKYLSTSRVYYYTHTDTQQQLLLLYAFAYKEVGLKINKKNKKNKDVSYFTPKSKVGQLLIWMNVDSFAQELLL